MPGSVRDVMKRQRDGRYPQVLAVIYTDGQCHIPRLSTLFPLPQIFSILSAERLVAELKGRDSVSFPGEITKARGSSQEAGYIVCMPH